MVNPRTKGATGERQAAKWLKLKFKLEHEPERNLEQVRFQGKGKTQAGFDLQGFPPFCFEIKRCETLDRRSWWVQCVNACTPEYHVPVVMFRQNRGRWRFLISAKLIGLTNGFMELEEREFIKWVEHYLSS